MSGWDAAPSESLWYGEVICEKAGEDTDYWYGYSKEEEPPAVEKLVPDGWTMLESTLKMTPGHPDYVPPEETDGDEPGAG